MLITLEIDTNNNKAQAFIDFIKTISKLSKAVKQEIYRLLVDEFKYFD